MSRPNASTLPAITRASAGPAKLGGGRSSAYLCPAGLFVSAAKAATAVTATKAASAAKAATAMAATQPAEAATAVTAAEAAGAA